MIVYLKNSLRRHLILISMLCMSVASHAQCATVLTDAVTPACGSLHSGTVTIHASNAPPPYQYRLGAGGSWQTDSLFTGLGAGSTTVYVMEAGGCIDSIVVVIGSAGTPFTPAITATAWSATFCNGVGMVDTFWASGSSAALTYQWYHNGAPISGATAATYITTVLNDHDSLWVLGYTSSPCATVDSAVSNTIHITAYTGTIPSVTATAASLSYCAGGGFVDTFWASSAGSAVLTYHWYRNGVAVTGATGSSWSTATLSDHDSIWVVAQGTGPCAAPVSSNILHISILPDTVPAISITAASLSFCAGSGFVDTFWAGGGTSAALTYQWYRNDTAISGATGASWVTSSLADHDSIWVVAYGATGCTAGDSSVSTRVTISLISCADTVWPGDADANHIADNNDLLPVGLAYGATGPVRTVQGIVWQGDSADRWSQYFSIYAPTVNYVHADCNGDGVVNSDDTLAIVTNFGLTHPKTNGYGTPRSGAHSMHLEFSRDTVYDGQSLVAAVILGDAAIPFANIYGIAFTYNYDPLVYDTNSISFEYINSWLGDYTNSINISKTFPAPGVIKTAITGIDHLDRSGWGAIARFRGTITTDNINGIRRYVNTDYITDITAVDMKGDTIEVNTCVDSNLIIQWSTGIHDITGGDHIEIYPNPARDYIQVTSEHPMTQVQLYDGLGELMMDNHAGGETALSFDVSGLASGIYMVRISTVDGSTIRKVTIKH